jgi:hypothetical protein
MNKEVSLTDPLLMNLIMDLWETIGSKILTEQNLMPEFKKSENLDEYHFGLFRL